jgi:hypothetical protein
MLFKHLKKTYRNLTTVSYFEGVDKTDLVKVAEFEALNKCGYQVKTLARKSYKNSPKYKTFKCQNCKEKIQLKFSKNPTL